MVGALGNGHDPFVHMQMSGTLNKSFSSSSFEISDSSHRPGGKRVSYIKRFSKVLRNHS